MIKSPLKWAGGKSKLLDIIYTTGYKYSNEYSRFVDVFAGSGVVALNSSIDKLWINDVNQDLIRLFLSIQNDKEQLFKKLQYLFSGEFNNSEDYLRLRDEFNEKKSNNTRLAALFVYLNKYGFNGLCRYNRAGLYNVPFGRPTRNPSSISIENFQSLSERMKNAEITNFSFEKVLSKCGKGDLVYCDPPYSPIKQKTNFTSYSGNEFGSDKQKLLVKEVVDAVNRGSVVIISNHKTKETLDLYKEAKKIITIEVGRSISRNGGDRKKVEEILAVYAKN